MKSILLSTAAIVGFAGAAAAEITFSGSATLGYNDTDLSGVATAPADDTSADEAGTWSDNEFGFYTDLDVTVGFSSELDNGLTVAASVGLDDLADGAGAADYELSLTSENAGLYFGDTAMAAASKWVAAGDMAADNFSKTDGETVLRGEVSYNGIDTAVSYIVDGGDLEQLSLGVSADVGNFNIVAGYQAAVSGTAAMALGDEDAAPANFNSDRTTLASGTVAGEDFNADEVFGISVGTTFGAADVRIAYAENGSGNSTGLSVTYPIGPVSVSASYADNSAGPEKWDLSATYADGPISVTASTDEADDWALEGSYDVGNGLTVFAGLADAGDDYYLAGSYDLGSGANLLVSYAVDETNSDSEDEIGANEYQEGATVELSFEF